MKKGFSGQELYVAMAFTDQQAMIRQLDTLRRVKTLDVRKFTRNVRAGGADVSVDVVVARFKPKNGGA